MKRLCFAAILTACLTPVAATAQDAEKSTIEERIPASVLDTRRNIFTLVVENDLFMNSDSNYTSGVRLSYMDVNVHFPAFVRDLAHALPGISINNTTSLYYSLGQNIFTPKDIQSPVQNPRDRPWAAYLYGSMGMATLSANHADEIELSLGVVGPAALGGPAQKFVHKHISHSPAPRGWHNQLKNEPGLMLAWQRTWPQFIKADIGPLFGSIAPYIGATLGNIYTYADVGINFRLGPDSEKWQDTPLRVRPAMPGTGFFEIPKNEWSWYLFAGIGGRAVARDIFLDGNTFARSHSVEKNNFVGDANAGLALTYGAIRISFTTVYRTKQFKTQDKPESFGAISIGYRF
ncbi:MAG: lipid A deacylase LpxR family protein [Rhodospirillales bacterium]|nr:lipid A deacylase LpxR family protein [Alphaproteobacteria bacterium]MCB9986866.1 lipid A deacylase LpxR family protein [Rhodospirillales bacterium]USO08373.1 MAG: lipid A deacylase LpxR family protein [Rhodospirillales bacterium]